VAQRKIGLLLESWLSSGLWQDDVWESEGLGTAIAMTMAMGRAMVVKGI
jgi:hypothetical protein